MKVPIRDIMTWAGGAEYISQLFEMVHKGFPPSVIMTSCQTALHVAEAEPIVRRARRNKYSLLLSATTAGIKSSTSKVGKLAKMANK